MNRPEAAPWWAEPAPLGETHHYLSLRDHIARRIEAGEIPCGAKLPSERQLQTGSGIARGTIREALARLEAEGLIYRRDRSGWYVSPPPILYDPTRDTGFMTYVSEQGRRPRTQTLSTHAGPAGADAPHVGVTPDAELYCIMRRRMIDDRPVLVERILVDPRMAPGLLARSLDGSLTRILEEDYGVRVAGNRIDMQPCALLGEEAAAIGVKAGSPGLLVVRTSFDAAGRVVEYDREYWRWDSVRIHVETQVASG
jgi:DNA-binding GntR family transcriptional regulator